MGELLIVSRAEVAEHLDYRTCIALMREAMAALSAGGTRQSLRTIIDLAGGKRRHRLAHQRDAGSIIEMGRDFLTRDDQQLAHQPPQMARA